MASVLVPLAAGFEELEAVTIIDILRRGGVDVVTAGLAPGPITASRGVQLVPDTTLDEVVAQRFDMVVLPGGQPGATNLQADPRVLQLVQAMVAANKYVAAICAAPMVLAEAGVLAGRQATSYTGALEPYADITLSDDTVVHDGKIITSRGPGTALDFALSLVELLTSREKRNAVEAALLRP